MSLIEKKWSQPSSEFVAKFRQWMNPRSVVWIIIGLGIVLRLVQYLYNRSLWLDEASLALNVIEKSFSGLLQPLGYDQMAPPGFLLVVKTLISIFGDGEYVLRLFPFVAGIISLFIFYAVARRVLSQRGLIFALGLFSISDPLLRYSSEFKQYSSDVAIALSISLMGLIWLERQSRFVLYTFLFSIIGSMLIWFSHPSIFFLSGVGIALAVHSLKSHKWKQVTWLSVPAFFWLGSFAVFYYVSLLEISQTEKALSMVSGWSHSFMPMPPLSGHDFIWFPNKFFEVFTYPGGLPLAGLAALCFVIGYPAKFFENRHSFYILTLPVLMALVASGLHKYPFGGRLILYIVPTLLIFIAEGVDQVIHYTKHTGRIVGISLCVLLLYHPVFKAASRLWNPIEQEEIKPILNYLTQHFQDGDGLYLYYGSWRAFKYYAKRYGLEDVELRRSVYSRNNWQNYVNDLQSLRGRERMWILFSHVQEESIGAKEEKFFLHVLDGMGRQVDSFTQKGASIYLYDLHLASR
jgi:hypothetical protein